MDTIDILLVEDTSTQAIIMKLMIESSGLSVEIKKTAEDALVYLESVRPGVVLSDINLPEMDGYEMTRIIKSNGNWKGIHVVLLVAFKDTRRYDATPYQWLLDWHFFQRTDEDCRMLFELAGFNMAALEMTRDATGVIMNFISHAAAPGVVRFDPPHAAAAPLHLAPPVLGAEGATIDPASVDAL